MIPAAREQPWRRAAAKGCCVSWQPPRHDLHRQLIVTIIQKAQENPPIRIGGDDCRRGTLDEFPAFGQNNYIALDPERPRKDELPFFNRVRSRICIDRKSTRLNSSHIPLSR